MAHVATALRSPPEPNMVFCDGIQSCHAPASSTRAPTADRVASLIDLVPGLRHALTTRRSDLSEAPLLRDLSDAQLARVLDKSVLRRFQPGEVIFQEGEDAECIHVLLSGVVELYTGEQPRERTFMILSRGDIFMPGAALGREPYLLSAKAIKPSRALLLDAEVVRRDMRRCPELASRMAMINAGQFRTLVRHLKDLKLRSGPERLAAFLLNLIDESPIPGSAELPLSKRMLASRMGMSPETLSRSIQLLADHGLRVRGDRAILDDRSRIERFCRPDPLIDGRESALNVSAF